MLHCRQHKLHKNSIFMFKRRNKWKWKINCNLSIFRGREPLVRHQKKRKKASKMLFL